MDSIKDGQIWVLGAKAARVLGCPAKQVSRLAQMGLLTVRRIPGCETRYLLEDVERLASRSTRPASAAVEGDGGRAAEEARPCPARIGS